MHSPYDKDLVCDYRKWPKLVLGPAGIALGLLMLVVTGLNLLGERQRLDYQMELLIGGTIGFVLIVAGMWGLLSGLNEKIAVHDGALTRVDLFGRVRVQTELANVIQGSFEASLSNFAKGLRIYRVRTTAGAIGWDENIRHCSDLNVIMQTACGQPEGPKQSS